jgi:hypothetical protein
MLLMHSRWDRSSMVRGALAVLVLCGLMAAQIERAQARIFIGLGIPLFVPPVVVPPPYYYPPYYAPPQAYVPPGNTFSYTPPGSQPQSLAPPRYAPEGYAPSGAYTPSMGGDSADTDGPQSCRAGAYVCPLVEDTPPGGACTCPGHGGQRIRGQAD